MRTFKCAIGEIVHNVRALKNRSQYFYVFSMGIFVFCNICTVPRFLHSVLVFTG